MNTFKKIAAVAMAAATLATTMLTAGAYKNKIELGELTPTANYTKAPTIHYSQLDDYFDNYATYSNVKSGVGSGCYVLSIDFTDDGSKVITDDVYDSIEYYVEFLYLFNANGKFITESRYPLTIDTWTLGDNGRVNVTVDSNNIFKGDLLEISKASFYLGKNYDGRKERDILKLGYTIRGAAVLPSYKIAIGGKECETKFDINYIDDLGTGKLATTCEVKVSIPHSYIANGETTLPVSINGVKIADITLSPTRSCPVYKNY